MAEGGGAEVMVVRGELNATQRADLALVLAEVDRLFALGAGASEAQRLADQPLAPRRRVKP